MFALISTGVLALGGVLLDLALGEPRRLHPLVGFGRLAGWIEQKSNHAAAGKAEGVLAWMLAVLPLVMLSQALIVLAAYFSVWLAAVMHCVLLYACIGLRSLREHNLPIQAALEQGDLPQARRLTSYIVSRDTEHGDASYLAKASVESVLENGCDAVFGTLFWFALAGGPGAVLYRLSNTLDAMWGYKNTRFLQFGWAAARIDDVLNFIPARLTAISYALLGNSKLAWQCWRTQAPGWPSPNAGPVMSSGAGALAIALGRSARYDGVDEVRPPLGEGRAAIPSDIQRAWQLVWRTTWLWIAVLLSISLIWKGLGNA